MQEHVFTSEDCKKLGVIFDRVKKIATVPADERKEKRQIVKAVLDELKVHMRLDTLFREMFSEFRYTGSYFDNLRIVNANEFDINVVLNLPVRRDRIMLEPSFFRSNFVALRINNWDGDAVVNLDPTTRYKFLKLLDDSGRLEPKEVLSWMQSVLAKALNNLGKFTTSTPAYKLSMIASRQCPATTLKITPCSYAPSIDVDLVAVFRFEPEQWTEKSSDFRIDLVHQVFSSRRRMYLVPKPHPYLPDCKWRKHFPEVEEELLNGKMAAKPVIRILKLLRDRCQWNNIASYYLKTLVMIEIHEVNDVGHWHDRRTPYLIFTMMKKLIGYFENQTLPHLLYRDVNLFEGLNRLELFNLSGRLKKIYQKWMGDIDSIEAFFVPGMNHEVEAILEEKPSYCTLL